MYLKCVVSGSISWKFSVNRVCPVDSFTLYFWHRLYLDVDMPCHLSAWSEQVGQIDTFYAPARRVGAVSVAFVRPSVRPSIAYIANNSRTQRPSVPKLGTKIPHLRCDSHTSFKIKSSKVRVTRPINADTHRAPYLPNAKAFELETWYTDGGRRLASATSAMTSKVKDQGQKVTWSVWAVLAQWPTNWKQIVIVSPKLTAGYPVTRATLRTSFKVKRWKVRITDRLTQTHKMCHIFCICRTRWPHWLFFNCRLLLLFVYVCVRVWFTFVTRSQ